jgi:O-antigen/teichoic acid export membrane protein
MARFGGRDAGSQWSPGGQYGDEPPPGSTPANLPQHSPSSARKTYRGDSAQDESSGPNPPPGGSGFDRRGDLGYGPHRHTGHRARYNPREAASASPHTRNNSRGYQDPTRGTRRRIQPNQPFELTDDQQEAHRQRQLQGLNVLISLAQSSAVSTGFPVIPSALDTRPQRKPDAQASPELGRGPRVWNVLRDPALRSAIALALSAILSGALGLGFWVRAAHYQSVAVVGHASAEVSAITFLAAAGSLNLMTALPRFLPAAGWNARRMLLASYGATALTGLTAAAIFVSTPLSSKLIAQDGASGRWAFALCVVANSIFMFQDGALVGFGKATWVPVENLLVAIARLGLIPVIAVAAHVSVVTGILWAWALPMFVSVLAVNTLNLGPLAERQSTARPNLPPPRDVLRWVGVEALTTILNASVTSFLPALVVWRLGDVQGGYFYVPWTITTMAALLLTNVFISMVREVIARPRGASVTIDRSLRLAAAFVVCGVLGCSVLGKFVLLALGPGYAANGGPLLLWIGFSFPAMGINLLYVAVCLIRIRPGVILFANCAMTIGVIGGLMTLGHDANIGSVGMIYCVVQWVIAAASAVPATRGILAIRRAGSMRRRRIPRVA